MSQASYEEEQSRLRNNYEGTGDLHIEVPQEIPEVNPEVFRDVEPILFRGFIHAHAVINDVKFVFKSLNQHEFEMIRLMTPGDKRLDFMTHFLAFGVFMVDGVSVLPDRDHRIPELADLFQGLGEGPIAKVVRHMSELNRRASRAIVLTEAYSMETSSRLRWAQLRGLDLTSTAATGIHGTSRLGLNWGQLTWRALNHYEDLKEQAEREWENAKFVASSMAGKGMSRVHSQDKHRREQEKNARVDRRDKILRFALLGESMEAPTGNAQMQVARTVEELAHQLEHDLKGEKDWHDLVVESYERQAQELREQRAQQLQNFQQKFEDDFGPHRLVGHTSFDGLTPEEVKFQVERRRQLNAQRLAAQQVPTEQTDPKMASFVEKWGKVKPEVSQKDLSQVPLIPNIPRKPGVPFSRK